ncbi:MAG: hypothetical protein FWF68_04375 [Spirochaetes bacterium]|nr:hypothetical protein [Brevinematales bacterium]MCL1958816.1 hypothetical protein [Spirochaetota bacterium]
MRIPESFINKFNKESENIAWGEIIIRAKFQNGKPVFFFDKHTSEKYIPDSMYANIDSCAMEAKTD